MRKHRMSNKLSETVLHNLLKPITISLGEGDEIYEILQLKAPSFAAAGHHRNINRLIAKAMNKRNMEMQKNITADVFKNVQEIQKMMAQLQELEGADEVEVKKEAKPKDKKGVVAAKETKEEEKPPTDNELLAVLDNVVLSNLDQKDVEDLYNCFRELLNTSHSHKLCVIYGYDKAVTPAVVLQLSLEDMDILLAKYIYFFTRLRQSLLTE